MARSDSEGLCRVTLRALHSQGMLTTSPPPPKIVGRRGHLPSHLESCPARPWSKPARCHDEARMMARVLDGSLISTSAALVDAAAFRPLQIVIILTICWPSQLSVTASLLILLTPIDENGGEMSRLLSSATLFLLSLFLGSDGVQIVYKRRHAICRPSEGYMLCY